MEKQREFEQASDRLKEIISTAKGSLLDLAYYIYKVIISVPGKEPDLLRVVFEECDQIESSEEEPLQKIFTEDEKEQYRDTYGKSVDGMLDALLKKGLSKEAFYQELWKSIQDNPMLEGEKEKAFAFFYIWIDVKVPYFELEPGLRMSNEEYKEIKKEIMEEIKRARFILSVPTKQKTERASRLVWMLENMEDERKKAVLMAQILNIYRQLCGSELLSKLAEDGMLVADRDGE